MTRVVELRRQQPGAARDLRGAADLEREHVDSKYFPANMGSS
ncbi:hypothetical protein MJO55_29075 (plasmid) [Mycolicibacterium rufum]|uniref:Uncharacterized protein n=1 Tax=Mycolicibacterium rufum TaxID=318424 RepID=A0ABY5TSR1_9MYCO|nr:hypothetical protein [Mycolicibacterium rufum]UVY95906.1 hypothetical protein MJO55_29075 [Mycolicibacterium rufum]